MPQRKLLVLLKERILLLNSQIFDEISGEYSWLADFLEQNPKAKTTDLHDFDEEVQNFFKYRYNSIITQAAAEWASHSGQPVDIRDKDEMFECELCHHKPIMYVCCIVNKLNDKELNVGTECVKHFDMKLGKDIRLLFKGMKKVRRTNRLERVIPGIDRTIFGWEGELEGFPLLIPLSLESSWLKLGERANKLYMDFLEEEIGSIKDQEYFDELQLILEQKKSRLKDIQEYVEKNKDAKFVPGKEIINWVKRAAKSKDDNLLGWLKEDGRVKWRTAFRIGEPNYLKSLISDFNGHMKSIGCYIEKMDNHKGSDGYIINVKSKQIMLFTRYREFILDFGGLLFGEKLEKPLDLKNLMLTGTVYGENSVNKIVTNLEKRVDERGYRLYKLEHEYNELILQQKNTDYYVIENLDQFVEKFKLLSLGLNEGDTVEFDGYFKILVGKKKSSKEDLDYLLAQR